MWKHREELGIHTIAYNYPINSNLRGLVKTWASAQRINNIKFSKKRDGSIERWSFNDMDHGLELEFKKMTRDLFHITSLISDLPAQETSLRVNTYTPIDFHAHFPTLILPITGLSTVFQNEAEEEYSIDNHLILFDKKMFHRAPKQEMNKGGRAYLTILLNQ